MIIDQLKKAKHFFSDTFYFSRNRKVFTKFLKNLIVEIDNYQDQRNSISIVITPWQFTPVPWYSITIGILLAIKNKKVEFILDDLHIDDIIKGIPLADVIQIKEIKKVLKIVEKFIPVKMISQSGSNPINKEEIIQLKKLAKLNSISKFKTSISTKRSKKFQDLWLARQLVNYPRIKNFFKNNTVNHLLLPGGVYGNSGLIKLAQNKDTLISTYDGGKKRAFFSLYGIAGYQDDVNKILSTNEFNNMNLDEIEYINKLVDTELSLRIKGKDYYKTQVVSSSINRTNKYDILMPLNITWDLPALGKHVPFENDFDWIIETADFILSNTNASLAIRQHPQERNQSSGKDLKEFLLNRYKGQERVTFISATDKFNTYDLLEDAKIVLPYVSTIGIEAAILNKTVIVESDNYYSDKSFVIKCTDKNAYFSAIKENLKENKKLPLTSIQEAKFTYYISQLCTAEITHFSPYPGDFEEWSKFTLDEIKNSKTINRIIDSLDKRIAPGILIHRNNLKMKNN